MMEKRFCCLKEVFFFRKDARFGKVFGVKNRRIFHTDTEGFVFFASTLLTLKDFKG